MLPGIRPVMRRSDRWRGRRGWHLLTSTCRSHDDSRHAHGAAATPAAGGGARARGEDGGNLWVGRPDRRSDLHYLASFRGEGLGGGAPANRLGERGHFACTETMYCRLTQKAVTDCVLSALERDLAVVDPSQRLLAAR